MRSFRRLTNFACHYTFFVFVIEDVDVDYVSELMKQVH